MWKRLSGFIGGLYRDLWSHTTKRPYTYIMRQHPIIPITMFIVAFVNQMLWPYLWVMIVADFVMVLTGHTLWDTAGAYIKYQTEFK
jgi:hypothetical protein